MRPRFAYSYRNPHVRRVAGWLDRGVTLFRRSGGMGKIPPGAPTSVTVVKLDHLGDAFLFLPALAAMAKAWPKAALTVVCQGGAAEIYRHGGLRLQVVTVPGDGRKTRLGRLLGETWFLFRTLRRTKADLVIDARGDARTCVAGVLARVPRRVGRGDREVFSSLLTERVPGMTGGHETENHRALLRSLRIPPPRDWKPNLVVTAKPSVKTKGKVLAVHAVAGYPYKIWPKSHFQTTLAAVLQARKGWTVHLLGGAADQGRLGDLVTGLPKALRPRVEILAGRLTVVETWAHLGTCRGFLGCDSLPAHFAASHGLPGVVLMSGAVDGKAWAPLSETLHVLQGTEEGHVCALEHCPEPCPHMAAIPAETVTGLLLTRLR